MLCLRFNQMNASTRHFLVCYELEGLDGACWVKRWRETLILLYRLFQCAMGFERQEIIVARALAMPAREQADRIGNGSSVVDDPLLAIYD